MYTFTYFSFTVEERLPRYRSQIQSCPIYKDLWPENT